MDSFYSAEKWNKEPVFLLEYCPGQETPREIQDHLREKSLHLTSTHELQKSILPVLPGTI